MVFLSDALKQHRKINEALIEAVKMAVFVLKKEEELTKERKKSMIKSLKGLVAQSEVIYNGKAPTEH